MASIRTVPFQVTTASTTQDITSSGFGTPVAALFILTGATADGTAADHARFSIGATDGTRSFVCSGYGQHGQTVSENKSYGDTTNVMDLRDMAAGATLQAAFSTWVTDGVRVNWGATPGTAYRGICILFGGDNMTAEVGTHTTSGIVGTENLKTYTDMTVAPECVICVSSYLNAMTGTESDDWDLSFGWGTSSTANVSRGWSLENSLGVNRAVGHCASDRIACWGDYAAGTRETLELTTLDTSGGKGRHGVTVRDSADGAIYGFLAFSTGGTASIGVELWSADFSATGAADYSGVSFKPAFALMGMSNIGYAERDADLIGNLSPTMGLAALDDLDSEGDAYSAQVQRNWSTASDTQSYYESTFISLPNQTGGIAYAGNTPSFTSDGIDFTVSNTVAQAKGIIILTVQEVVAAPSGIASTSAVGSPTVNLTVFPDGILVAARTGSPTVNQTVFPNGISVGARCGNPIVAGPVSVTGIASTSGVGSPTVGLVAQPDGIASTSAVGTPTVDLTIFPNGIAATSGVGSPIVDNNPLDQTVVPTGVVSTVAVGTPQIDLTIFPQGVLPASAVGSPTITIAGAQTLQPLGIASTVAVGVPLVRRVGDMGIAGGQATTYRAHGRGSVHRALGQGTRAKARGMAAVGG